MGQNWTFLQTDYLNTFHHWDWRDIRLGHSFPDSVDIASFTSI